MIEFPCPECMNTIRVSEDAGGKPGTCNHCRAMVRIPEPEPDTIRLEDPPEPKTPRVGEPLVTKAVLKRSGQILARIRPRLRPVYALWLLPVIIGGGIFAVTRDAGGRLPTKGEIEANLEFWGLEPRPAVLRGRPLTQVPFTWDASTGEMAFSLYMDDAGTPVALASAIVDAPTEDDTGIEDDAAYIDEVFEPLYKVRGLPVEERSSEINRSARKQWYKLMVFSDEFLERAICTIVELNHKLRLRRFREVDRFEEVVDPDDPTVTKSTFHYDAQGFDVEFTRTSDFADEKRNAPPWRRTWIWIVKSRDW